jgi:hypothetical protein
MPSRASGPQSGATAEDQTDTGPDTVPAINAAGDTVALDKAPTPTAEAAESGGAKLVRTVHPGDRFVYDAAANAEDRNKGVVDGRYREFPATQAKETIAAARAAGVRLLVADKEA